MGCGRARREASLRHCGRNLYVSGWGAGGLGGKPAYAMGCGKARRQASLWHCGKIFLRLRIPDGVWEGSGEALRNLYVSGWGAGRLGGRPGGKPAYGTAVGIFTSPDGVGEG